MLFSVIVPTYNAEKTIRRCLDSVIKQPYPSSEYEIIVVDDGSSDETPSIVNSYSQIYDNVTCVLQQNSGAGAARNQALKIAKGEYLLFIDADDFITQNSLGILSSRLQEVRPDILLFKYFYYDEGVAKYSQMSARDRNIYDNEARLFVPFRAEEYPKLCEAISYPWNKIYKRDFIEKNGITFSETVVHNDVFFNIASIVSADSIVMIPEELYVHFINTKDKQLTQIFDERRLDAIRALEQVEEFFNIKNIGKNLRISYLAFKINLLFWIVERCEGELRTKFVNYLNISLDRVPTSDLLSVCQSSLITNKMKVYMKSRGLPFRFPINSETDKPLLSVVVPMYNVGNYISQCLNSIANQTLDSRLYEVIIVDDKSTDDSAEIAGKFCSRYTNFHLIKLDTNTPGGAGIPSNIGIEKASGEYIGFVDSDDFISPTMFEEMLWKAVSTEADVVVCDFGLYYQETGEFAPSYDKKKFKHFCEGIDKKLSIKGQRKDLLSLSPVPWRKLYKKSFMDENSIRYPEGDFFYEDNPLHWFVSTTAQKISYVNEVMIYHRMGRPGQTMGANPEKLLAFTTHAKTIKDFLLQKDKYEDFKNDFLTWSLNQSSWIIPKLEKYRSRYCVGMKKVFSDIKIGDIKLNAQAQHKSFKRVLYNYLVMTGKGWLVEPLAKIYKLLH